MDGMPFTVIGHRGARQNPAGPAFAENSLPAFARAFELGADEAETDLALSKDGLVFLRHDELIATPSGRRGVASLPFEEIRAAAPHTPLLVEALQAFPGRGFVLELKRHTPVEAILAKLREAGFAAHRGRLRFISFHRRLLLAAGKEFPDIPRAWIATSNEGRFDPLVLERHVRQCIADGTAEICGHWRLIFGGTARRALESGLDLGLGQINSGASLRRSLKLGANRLYTDDIPLVLGASAG